MILTRSGLLSTISMGMYMNNQHVLLYLRGFFWVLGGFLFVGWFVCFLKSLSIDTRSFSCEALVFFPLLPQVVSFLHTFYAFAGGSYASKMALSFCLSQATSSNP